MARLRADAIQDLVPPVALPCSGQPPASRQRLLDDSLPIKDRVYNVSHYVVEDIGGGPELIWLDFISAEEMGFDMARFKRRTPQV